MEFKYLFSNIRDIESKLDPFFNTIFFPRRLANRVDNPGKDEHHFISLIIESLKILSNYISQTTIDLSKVFEVFKSWYECQSSEFINEDSLHDHLKSLKPNRPFLLYLRGQNAAISIYHQKDDSDLITAFQPSCFNKECMSNPSDLCNVFPKICLKVLDKTILYSKAFASYLSQLANFSNDLSKAVAVIKNSECEEFRDSYSPVLVYEWFLAFCCSEPPERFVQIIKKYRDHVVSDFSGQPFRRCGIWMTAKVFLNVLLVEEFGDAKGKALYKAVLIYSHLILAKLLQGDIEKKLEVVQKLAKRTCKLSAFKNVFPGLIGKIEDELNNFILRKKNMMENNLRKNLSKSQLVRCKLNPNFIDFQHTEHDFSDFRRLIDLSLAMDRSASGKIICSRDFKRHLDEKKIPEMIFKGDGYDYVILNDFEAWVRYSIDMSKNYSSNVCQYIFKLISPYIKYASKFYTDDPLGYSRMVLTVYKIIAVIDKIATSDFPLLLDHKLGVSTKLFQHLLLPRKSDIHYAQELFNYFTEREKALLPNLLENKKNLNDLFAIRFCQNFQKHAEKKRNLEKIDAWNIEEKKREVIKAVNSYKLALKEAEKMICNDDQYFDTSHNTKACLKCNRIRSINGRRVKIYEKLLPDSPIEKDLVIFELVIPQNISILRDSIYLFHKRILNEKIIGENLRGSWVSEKKGDDLYAIKTKVTLGSTYTSFKDSHFNSLLLKQNFNENSYIKSNGYNIHYSNKKFTLKFDTNSFDLKDFLTFKTEKHYKNLQWVLSTATYTENQAIANQGMCPPDMTKKEYLKFSMFRAGINLQLYNLLDAVETRILPFKNNSVYYLICQSLWELGPIQESSEIPSFPKVHELLAKDHYLDKLYISVSDLLDTCIHNWNEHIILLNITTISLRVVSMTTNEVQKIKYLDLLSKVRKINVSWQDQIEDMIARSDTLSEIEKSHAKGKLLEICCIFVLTFFVDRFDFKVIFQEPREITDFFMSLTKIYDHQVLYKDSSSPLRNNLLNWVKQTMNDVESFLPEFVLSDIKLIKEFLDKKWPDSMRCKISKVFYMRHKRCFEVKLSSVSSQEFEVEIGLDGAFLINNMPVSKLPNEISSHDVFQRLFGRTDFDLLPSSSGSSSHTTKWIKISEKARISYTFSFSRNKNSLNITEICDTDEKLEKLELIHHDLIKPLVPSVLSENFSHWLDKTKNQVIFRAKNFNDKTFYLKSFFKLCLTNNTIEELSSGRLLINLKSSTFKELYSKLGSLMDKDENMHVYLECKEFQKITIDLPRFGLSFELDQKKTTIFSKEFRGFQVSEDQSLGTLIGLERGLVLIDKRNSDLCKKKLIVPHGKLLLLERKFHPIIEIKTETLFSPSFFIYEVDNRVRILRAGESLTAWLYLANLHAITSSIIPDPFLKITGTGRALQILQSPHVFSCSPLDKQAYQILLSISRLSPDRNFYPANFKLLEKVTWPKYLNSYASHDAFQYLCKKIIEDSNRLGFLYEKKDLQEELKLNDNHKDLYVKGYNRLLTVEMKLKTENEILMIEKKGKNDKLLAFGLEFNWVKEKVNNVKRISSQFKCTEQLSSFWSIFNELGELTGVTKKITTNTIIDWISIRSDFLNCWLYLYEICRTCSEDEKVEVLFGLSFLAYLETDMKLLLVLKVVLENQSFFRETEAPSHSFYEMISKKDFDKNEVENIVRHHAIEVEEYHLMLKDGKLIDKLEVGKMYQKEIDDCVILMVNYFENQWPCSNPKESTINLFRNEIILEKITILFKKWLKNIELFKFFKRVELLSGLFDNNSNSNIQVFSFEIFTSCLFTRFEVVLDSSSDDSQIDPELLKTSKTIYNSGSYIEELLTEEIDSQNNSSNIPNFPLLSSSNTDLENFMLNDLKESWKAHQIFKNFSKNHKTSENLEERLKTLLKTYNSKIKELTEALEKSIILKFKTYSTLKNSLILPELTPSEIQKQVINQRSRFLILSQEQVIICGAICVLWTLEQRIERCLNYLDHGESQSLALSKELENVPYKNWSPQEFPSWIVLQIELDLMIRPVQVEVAKAMMFPEGNQSLVTQLNMGEGKTSVILPMIVMVLADGKFLLRVTVLKSLFNMNRSSLTQKLGGILDKRVYVVPCRRDRNFELDNVDVVKRVLEECLRYRGVLISLPEYRLSFMLKGLEMGRKKGDLILAKKLNDIEKWLKVKGRDILDESDEILSPKYQLIYTIGQQSSINCGSLRWQVCQSVLDLCKFHFIPLHEKYGDSSVSLSFPSNTLGYPHFRLLKEDPYKDLCKEICINILKGKAKQLKFFELKDFEIDSVSHYILDQEVPADLREKVLKIFPKNSEKQKILTILRGLLAYEILLTVLSKRWRVNYGVNSKYLMQAVPFRAKDVPADRAQFAHPDIMILLTQLSYFYSGLTDQALDEVFRKLQQEPDPDPEYDCWISSIPQGVKIHESIKSFKGINLSESSQKYQILYPLLRMHTPVINYWLNSYVYPKEAKEFSGKLENSAWDLCPEETITTGFSGTNDSRLLLPINTGFLGIPKLIGTNGSLIESLLLPENNEYHSMKSGITSKEILKKMSETHKDLRLLLDVGALMLELSNLELVQDWLAMRTDLEAGVFFDESNDLKVLDRKGVVVPFDMSPYKNHLQFCVIYLDDSHTRGTDLKIPQGTVGAVTLGKGLTKDKLMQACMRMRMLGHGHRVCFFACHEVDFVIKQLKADVGAKEVLEWVINNTRDMIIEQLLYWAVQGISYYRRLQIFRRFLITNDLNEYSLLYENKDVNDVSDLYASDRVQRPVNEILHELINRFTRALNLQTSESSAFKKSCQKIIEKVEKFIGSSKVFSHLFDEEQELELEIEKEEERHKENPKSAIALSPCVSSGLEKFIMTGEISCFSQSLIPIGKGFSGSSVLKISQEKAWSKDIFLTRDFVRTVKSEFFGDDFLRPPRWVCFNPALSRPQIVVISAFEANELLEGFEGASTGLVMFMPRNRIDQNHVFTLFEQIIPQNLLQQLAVFAGSLFFHHGEVDEYLKFIGYCPSPRNEIEEKLFNSGFIQHCGFVEPENRIKVFGHMECLFEENPEQLVIRIAEIRNFGVLSKFSHVFELFRCGKRPFH